MTATIRDVAKKAGVGVGTVSRVINESPNVSPLTRERVLAAVSALNYVPNPIARRLSLGKTLTIGAIVPTFTRPSFVERLRGVVNTLGDSEYDLIIYNVETREQRKNYIINRGVAERIDGLVVISLAPTQDEVEYFSKLSTPTVFIDTKHPSLSSVYIDDIKGGYQATKHLIDLGHRHIGFLSDYVDENKSIRPMPILGNRAMANRLIGYQQALAEANIPFNPSLHKQNLHGRSAAYDSALELLKLENRPTAIFAASDTQAIGVLQAARDLKIDVPNDLSVIGYDDIEQAEYLQLTTIRQSLLESGIAGARLILEALASPNAPAKYVKLETSLIVRSTTAEH